MAEVEVMQKATVGKDVCQSTYVVSVVKATGY